MLKIWIMIIESAGMQGLETNITGNFDPEANSSVHHSHMHVITIDDIKVYKKH